MKKSKSKMRVLEHPDRTILIQIKEKQRTEKGNLEFKGSRSLTVHNATLDEVYDRIDKALK